MQRVSLKFLAKELGVTEGTVSRALNNYPDISEATRQRVLEVAEKFNYKANPTARRLATGVAEAVAYLMPPNTNAIAEPFVSIAGRDRRIAGQKRLGFAGGAGQFCRN